MTIFNPEALFCFLKKHWLMRYLRLICVVALCCFSIPSFSFSIQLLAKDAACGNNNGSITVEIFGGSPPFNYMWSNGITTQNLDNLSPGTYTIVVADAMGSVDSATAIIGDTAEVIGGSLSYVMPNSMGITHPCNSMCNGIAYLSVSYMNGTPPYNIGTSLSHPIGTFGPTAIPTVENICATDMYTVFVTDALGCTGTAYPTYAYPVNNTFNYSAQITPACGGVNNGQAILTFNEVQGSPVSAVWTGPSPGLMSSMSFTIGMLSLLPGNYAVTVTNDNSISPCDTVILITIPDMGSNCGTISGKVYLDSTSNCINDVSEPFLPSRIVRFTPGPYYATSDNAGNYTATLPYGNYLAETVDNGQFTSVCTVSGIALSSGNSTITNIDLGDSTGTDLDLSLHLTASAARPGFTYNLYLSIWNESYIVANAPEVVLDYDGILSLTSSSLPYTVTGPSQITIQFPTIGSFGNNFVQLNFLVPPNPALIGTMLTNFATLNANQPEPNLSNNTEFHQQMITGSFDPNAKSVWPGWDPQNYYLVDVDSLFRYTIEFQNTGNDTAFNVMLVDTLNEYLDITSFEMLGSSHTCNWEITGQNILKVHYDNILLPDSNTNESASHGLFSFSMTHTPALEQVVFPYILENTAGIYFDFNPPVITNTIYNTIDISVGISEINNASIQLRPNPAHDLVTVTGKNPGDITSITLTDMLGRTKQRIIPESAITQINLENLPAGLYMIVAEGVHGVYNEKLIKY